MIEIIPLGGGQEIGANSYFIKWNGTRILLDCGMNPKEFGYRRMPRFELIDGELDLVFISHAHLDHVGSLPILTETYKCNRIVTDINNIEIIKIMLNDSAKILQNYDKANAEFYKKYFQFDIIYDIADEIEGIKNAKWINLNKEISFRLHSSGHIAGASGIELKSREGEVLFYTGDFTMEIDTLAGGEKFPRETEPDVMIVETTNGMSDYDENERNSRVNLLINDIDKTLRRGGYVLLPAFALGKTQELVNLLKENRKSFTTNPKISVVGMGNKITPLYEDIYGADLSTKYLRNIENAPRNIIVVATNGMMYENTASYVFAQKIIEDENALIGFTGYLDPLSYGAKLLSCRQGEEIDGKTKKAKVKQYSLSLHPSKQAVVQLAEEMNPKSIVLVHGDKKAGEEIGKHMKCKNVIQPDNAESLLYYDGALIRRKEMKNYIVTVGTSLLGNYKRSGKEKREPSPEDLLNFIVNGDISEVSAETNTINKLKKDIKGSNIHFISSDTKDCELCSEALSTWAEKELKTHSEVRKIRHLNDNPKDFESKGLINFIDEICSIIVNAGKNVEILATGGYKAEIAYATTMALTFDLPVYYVFENFKSIVTLPGMPIKLDMTIYGMFFNKIQQIKDMPDADKAGKIVREEFPSKFELLFNFDKRMNRYVDSPLGKIYLEYYKSEFWRRDLGKDFVRSSGTHSYLQGKSIKSLDDIEDKAIKTILKRIYELNYQLIEDITFDEFTPKRKAKDEAHLEFEKRIEEVGLSYKALNSSGMQRINIYTQKYMNEELLKRIGKKIYE